MTQYEAPLHFPPADIVEQFSQMSEACSPLRVLDAGCGIGRNALFLAEQGHRVVAMNLDLGELRAFKDGLDRFAFSGSIACVAGDVRRPPFGAPDSEPLFDVSLVNEVLHFMTKRQSWKALATVRQLTCEGGFNVVSGYVVRPGTANRKNTDHCFHPDELGDIYASQGWKVRHYSEMYYPNQYSGPANIKEHIFSRAKLIAQKPKNY